MKLDKADFMELTRAADRIRLSELALAERQRQFREIAIRLGLKGDVPYTYNEDTFEVQEYGPPNRHRNR